MNKNDLTQLIEALKLIILDLNEKSEAEFNLNKEKKTLSESYVFLLEAIDTLTELIHLHHQLSDKNTFTRADEELIYDFFEKRWLLIEGSDSEYCYACPINPLLLKLAKGIVGEDNDDLYQLLMPNVKFEEKHFKLKLHQFIINPKDKSIIPIKDVLSNMLEHKGVMFYKINDRYSYIDKECYKRIRSHSELADNFISTMTIHDFDPLNEEILRAKSKFTQSIDSDQYEVTATCSELARRRLFEKLMHKFINFQQLINFMTTHCIKWHLFIRKIYDQDFAYIVSNGAPWQELLTNLQYSNDTLATKAKLFCIIDMYWRFREKRGEYNSMVGYYGDSFNKMFNIRFFPVCDKTQKEKAKDAIQEFLMSDKRFDEFDQFLEEYINDTLKSSIFNDSTAKQYAKDHYKSAIIPNSINEYIGVKSELHEFYKKIKQFAQLEKLNKNGRESTLNDMVAQQEWQTPRIAP